MEKYYEKVKEDLAFKAYEIYLDIENEADEGLKKILREQLHRIKSAIDTLDFYKD